MKAGRDDRWCGIAIVRHWRSARSSRRRRTRQPSLGQAVKAITGSSKRRPASSGAGAGAATIGSTPDCSLAARPAAHRLGCVGAAEAQERRHPPSAGSRTRQRQGWKSPVPPRGPRLPALGVQRDEPGCPAARGHVTPAAELAQWRGADPRHHISTPRSRISFGVQSRESGYVTPNDPPAIVCC